MRRRYAELEQEKAVANVENRGVAHEKYDNEIREFGRAWSVDAQLQEQATG